MILEMPQPGSASARILVVEDDGDWVRLITRILQDEGFEVAAAVTAAEAVQALKRERLDAMITDVRMPGASGLKLLEHLRATPETEGLPVLVLTGSVGDPDLEKALADMPKAVHMQKAPFSAEELVLELRRLISEP
jgi:CheY-like chemotaxis protein